MKRLFVKLGILLALFGCSASLTVSASDDVNPGTAAQQLEVAKAADGFLTQLDAGAFEATWTQRSPHLDQKTTRATWVGALRVFRAGVGEFQRRKLKGVGFTDTIEGVPPGDYVAVGFDTDFSVLAVEEKVVMHKVGGQWKVLGYFLTKRITIGATNGDDSIWRPLAQRDRRG